MSGALRTMWWHADLPELEPLLAAPAPAPEPSAPGEALLDWILPTLAGEPIADEGSDPNADSSVVSMTGRRLRGSRDL